MAEPTPASRRRLLLLIVGIAVVLIAALVPLVRWATDPLRDPSGPIQAPRPARTTEQFYFVMTDRFANGDPSNDTGGLVGDRLTTGYDPRHPGFYHGGDLAGVMAQLDYIQGLGTTAIWLTPAFVNKPVQGTGENASAGYHGYWITDFTQIDPHLGSNDEMKQLITAIHDRGMRIYFDIIVNHTADVISYAGGKYDYISKVQQPYRDASGQVVDDAALAASRAPFPELDANSFAPYQPVLLGPDATVKQPAWLNDPTMYHNRGDSTWAGESVTHGDFFGLDDLFTERPEVVAGFTEIYRTWLDWGVDGFRIDTVKHVNMEFWQQFAPALAAAGGDDYFAFGEVFSTDIEQTSRYTTTGQLPAVLDFGFQQAAVKVAQLSSPAELAAVWDNDDYLIDADSSPYQSPTFLGNHDMGRIGMMLTGSADQQLARARFAHSLLFLTRGQPVVYYGDEQGLTGTGGDQAARQDLFATQTPRYAADAVIGGEPGSRDRYDTDHPLYRHIAALAELRAGHPGLVDGAQLVRFVAPGAGLLVTSRIAEAQEYVVVANNSNQPASQQVRLDSRDTVLEPIFGGGQATAVDAAGNASVSAEPMSVRVYRVSAPLPDRQQAPTATFEPIDASRPELRVPIEVSLSEPAFSQVSFFVRPLGAGRWTPLGTDDAPHSRTGRYRVLPDLSGYPAGSEVQVRAVVTDASGNASRTETTVRIGG